MSYENVNDDSTPDAAGRCAVCGKLANIHMTEIRDSGKITRSVCREHAPPELWEKLARDPAHDVEPLRRKLAAIDGLAIDENTRAALRKELEHWIADIEAGKRRLGEQGYGGLSVGPKS
jgi:hypothetical protein